MVELSSGVRLHLAEAGVGEPLLLLHGWPQHWFMWRKVMPALAQRYRVIAPDMRGSGWSDAPRSGYEKESLATDLLDLLDALGLERVRLIGHDWGGWVGFLACLRAPERFERFVALGIPSPMFRAPPRAYLDGWRFAYQLVAAAPGLGYAIFRHLPAFVTLVLRRGTSNPDAYTDEEVRAYARRLQEPARARAAVQTYRTFLARELLPLVRGRYRRGALRTPTLALFGSEDPAIRPYMVGSSPDHAVDLSTELVEGCGHFIAEERPELVTERALQFFNRS